MCTYAHMHTLLPCGDSRPWHVAFPSLASPSLLPPCRDLGSVLAGILVCSVSLSKLLVPSGLICRRGFKIPVPLWQVWR